MPSLLKPLGVYGFEPVEPVILAALVTGDPLLLIGSCGTGKTFLLNSLSETLGLEHRHYNASLIAFDDLVGFPYPDEDRTTVHYLETPATVWAAESVLVDEINRCKPEHQNRLFSLVHERRIQGLRLENLRYRWAAMNPATTDQAPQDTYAGTEPLDQALADRFAFLVEVSDWSDFDEETQTLIADPRGDGAVSDDGGALKRQLVVWRKAYDNHLQHPPKPLIEYSRTVATVLGQGGIRISPRRVRQLVKNLLGVVTVQGRGQRESDFLMTLRWSLPHRAWGAQPKAELLRAAHRAAWDAACLDGAERWLHDFTLEMALPRKVKKLLAYCPDPDTGTLAVTRLLATESPERAAAFAFAVYPAGLAGKLPIGKEAIADLGRLANEILDLEGEIQWQERISEQSTAHPEYSRLSRELTSLRGARRERATQLFYYLLVKKVTLMNPTAFEKDFNSCVSAVRAHLRKQRQEVESHV